MIFSCPYPNIYAFIQDRLDNLTHPLFSDMQQKLQETSAPTYSENTLQPIEALFEKPVDLEFTQPEIDYLLNLSNSFNFTGDISVFDWVHYHGYLRLKEVSRFPEKTLNSYLSLYAFKSMSNFANESQKQEETPSEQLKFYFEAMRNPKYFPTQKYQNEIEKETIQALQSIIDNLKKFKKSTSLRHFLSKVKNDLIINISIMNKLSTLPKDDFLDLRFNKIAYLENRNQKTKFWKEMIGYIDYLKLVYKALHLRGMSMQNRSFTFIKLQNEIITCSQTPSIDDTMHLIWKVKEKNASRTNALGKQLTEDLELVRTEGLTHEMWAAKRQVIIKYPKSQSDLASFLRYESLLNALINANVNAILGHYCQSLHRALKPHSSVELYRLMTCAVIDCFIEDQSLPTLPNAALTNEGHQRVYKQFEEEFAALKLRFETHLPENCDLSIYQELNSIILINDSYKEKDYLAIKDGSVGLIELQSQYNLEEMQSIKRAMVDQFARWMEFLRSSKHESPEIELKPLAQSLVDLICAHNRLIHRILSLDAFANVKTLQGETENFLACPLSFDEKGFFLIGDQRVVELFGELESYLDSPIEDSSFEEESESSEEFELALIPSVSEEETSIACSSSSTTTAINPPSQSTTFSSASSSTSTTSTPLISTQPRPSAPSRMKLSFKVVPPPALSSSSMDSPESSPLTTMRHRNVKSRKLLRILKNLGYTINRQKGSHMTLTMDNRSVTVPNHSTIKRGTLGSIIKQIE